jgi:hypothetical protein
MKHESAIMSWKKMPEYGIKTLKIPVKRQFKLQPTAGKAILTLLTSSQQPVIEHY